MVIARVVRLSPLQHLVTDNNMLADGVGMTKTMIHVHAMQHCHGDMGPY